MALVIPTTHRQVRGRSSQRVSKTRNSSPAADAMPADKNCAVSFARGGRPCVLYLSSRKPTTTSGMVARKMAASSRVVAGRKMSEVGSSNRVAAMTLTQNPA